VRSTAADTFSQSGDDDTAGLQAYMDANPDAILRPGIYNVSRLTIRSGARLRGAGRSTILRQIASTNGSMLRTHSYDIASGNGGEYEFSVTDLVLDGNKANQSTPNDGLQIYGCAFDIERVVVQNCAGIGIVSAYGESATSGSVNTVETLESRLYGVKVVNCEGGSIDWAGPHDSQWANIVCATYDLSLPADFNVRVRGLGGGLDIVNCHLWGLDVDVALRLDAGQCSVIGGQIEAANDYQVLMTAGGQRIVGTHIYGRYDHSSVGVQIGLSGGSPVPSCLIDARLSDCGTTWVGFGNDAGGSLLRFVTWGTASAPSVGSKHANTTMTMVSASA
jgi:hypothetical protein